MRASVRVRLYGKYVSMGVSERASRWELFATATAHSTAVVKLLNWGSKRKTGMRDAGRRARETPRRRLEEEGAIPKQDQNNGQAG